jgi:hypothetical protein
MRRAVVWVSALVCAATAGSCAVEGDPFIALRRDFVDFQTWERVELAPQPSTTPGAPPLRRFVYVNRRPPPGATEFPVGTILVKTVENGAMDTWEIHAMVKRGGGYNASGAVGWEYFEFVYENGVFNERWRGSVPNDGRGYTDEMGAVQNSCNSCHATPEARAGDSVLTPALGLGAH